MRRLHFCCRASKLKNTWEKFLHECGSKHWISIPGLKLLDPSAARQSFLQLFSDMSVSRLIPPKQSGGIVSLSRLTSCAAWLNKVKEISHLQACVHRFRNGVLVTMVWVLFGFMAVNWKNNGVFALFSCMVDVSDANVCHGVWICRWHACLNPPVLCYLHFCQIWRHLPSYFYNMDIMHCYRDRYI